MKVLIDKEHPGDITFLIYQLKNNDSTRALRFEPLERLKAAGGSVEWGNYNHMYTGIIDSGAAPVYAALEKLYGQFNLARPADFAGHSLSVSDVVVLRSGGKSAAYYIDGIGFTEIPGFLDAPYRYYSTQRPVDVGAFPKTEGGPIHFANYDKREYCENATFRAWGYLAYDAPLTEKQIADFELRAASDNPGREPVSPYQSEAQLQIIGKYEDSRRMAFHGRMTWFHNDFGVYVKYENVTSAQLAERYGAILEAQTRADKQAARREAAEPAPQPPEKPSVLEQIRVAARAPAAPKTGRPARKKQGPEL